MESTFAPTYPSSGTSAIIPPQTSAHSNSTAQLSENVASGSRSIVTHVPQFSIPQTVVVHNNHPAASIPLINDEVVPPSPTPVFTSQQKWHQPSFPISDSNLVLEVNCNFNLTGHLLKFEIIAFNKERRCLDFIINNDTMQIHPTLGNGSIKVSPGPVMTWPNNSTATPWTNVLSDVDAHRVKWMQSGTESSAWIPDLETQSILKAIFTQEPLAYRFQVRSSDIFNHSLKTCPYPFLKKKKKKKIFFPTIYIHHSS